MRLFVTGVTENKYFPEINTPPVPPVLITWEINTSSRRKLLPGAHLDMENKLTIFASKD